MATNLEVTWNGEDVKVRMKNTVKKSLLQTALAIQAQAIALCQVDTGNLRGSIQVKLNTDKGMQKIDSPDFGNYKEGTEITDPEEETAHVGSACKYAAAQEFGLADFNKPNYQFHPFLRPAKDLIEGQTLTIFDKNGRIEFKEYFQESAKGKK